MIRFILALVILFGGLSEAGHAGETRKAQPGAAPVKASFADLGWLEGSWSGEGLGGNALVVYSGAYDGQMVGHFRQGKNDKIQFYEIVAVVDVGGSLEYRVKHFNADLTGWEEKAVIQSFPLVAVEKDVWYFDGLTIRRTGEGSMVETVLVERKDGKTFEAAFTYTRTKK
jgi:hypothetical protein